jgi:hypothetical protein
LNQHFITIINIDTIKKVHAIPVIILFAITAGCGENKQPVDDLITVDVTATYPKKDLTLQDFFDVEYIPLKTSDEFLTKGRVMDVGKDILLVANQGKGIF